MPPSIRSHRQSRRDYHERMNERELERFRRRLEKLEERVNEQSTPIEDSRRAREKYVPVVEQTAEQVRQMQQTLSRLEQFAHNIDDKLGELSEKFEPMFTERKMILRGFSFLGGVMATIATSVVVWIVVEWLKTR